MSGPETSDAEARLERNMQAAGRQRQRRGALVLDAKTKTAAAPFSMHADSARLSIIHLFAHMQPKASLIDVTVEGLSAMTSNICGTAGKATLDGVTKLSADTLSTVEEVMQSNQPAANENETDHRSVLLQFKDWMSKLFNRIYADMKEKYGTDPKTQIGEFKALINMFVRIFAEKALPFVSGGMNIAKGLANTVSAVADRVKLWWRERKVELMPGHPQSIVNALKKAMSRNILSGLYDVAKGALEISLTAATAGASTIVSIAAAFTEAVVKILWRVFEASRVAEFCSWCLKAWNLRSSPQAPHKDPREFGKVFRAITSKVPTVAALAFKDPNRVSKMYWIQVYSDDGTPDYAKYKQGISMFDALDGAAVALIKDMGFSVKSEAVDVIVENIKRSAKAPKTFGGKVLKFSANMVQY